ncbi:MAG: MBOAT family protein [Butyrivibrio sp.]|nr:MBOAT family protein [Butyrivibrio sp.]
MRTVLNLLSEYHMSLISAEFLLFIAIVIAIFYCVPGKAKRLWIGAANIVFLYFAGGLYGLSLWFLGAAVVYLGAMVITKGGGFLKKLCFWVPLIINLAILIITRYQYIHPVRAPFGVSFYTLILLSYLIDVYWGKFEAVLNPVDYFSYAGFFPAMTSGPIIRYKEFEANFKDRIRPDYKNLVFGMERILWGFFKKLVISERFAVLVNTVFGDYKTYSGAYIIFGVICFAFQLYTDFSGCMDIVMGVSEAMGMKIPENFTTPFFSRSESELWRRWHITLGTWFKDYIMYPLQKTDLMVNFSDICRKKFGRKTGKKVGVWPGLLILWFLIGYWHGGLLKFVIGSGLLHAIYMICGQINEPWLKKVHEKLGIKPETGWYVILCRVRTFLLLCSGFMFFRADSTITALRMYGAIFTGNMGLFSVEGIASLGLDIPDLVVAAVSLLILFIAECFMQAGSVREKLYEKNVFIRALTWSLLAGAVMIFGMYGPAFEAGSFIYQNF